MQSALNYWAVSIVYYHIYFKARNTRGSRGNVNIVGKYWMTPSITEVFSHLALGTSVSLVCTLDTVGSHPSGLISGVK